jgi:hypothetical protein
MTTLNWMLSVATILGGIAAIWFFQDKIAEFLSPNLLRHASRENIERLILESDADTDWTKAQTSAKQTISYVHNPNLGFEMSHLDDGVQQENFIEAWANKHPDPKAVGLWCDLFFGSSQIERFILVGVDGMRALVPPPRRPNRAPGGTQIQPLDYKVAKIHDSLKTLDEYIGRSGLSVAANVV